MRVEVDQSGKVEQLDTDTVVAYSNGKSNAFWITAGTKRRIVQAVRRSLIPENEMEALWFAVVVYLLIRDLPNGITFIIDEEYTGKNSVIEQAISKLLNLKFKGKWNGNIRFKLIGKLSPAHRLAWKWHKRKRRSALKRLKEEEILKWLK